MPLPDNGAAWPPPDLEPVFDRMATWSAWYGGDADELAWIYQGQGRHHLVHDRPSQYRGGVVGRLARWFWGAPTPMGEKRAKLHVPLAADLASLSADLLFAEPPTITAEDAATQDRLTELIDDGVHSRLREGAEISAALSGSYLRVVWDREVSPRPWLAAAHPDCAVPEWRWDKLAAVTFWRIISWTDQEVVRHLERHEPGAILHAVYVGTPEILGRRVALTDFEETAPLADSVTDGDVVETGVEKLTASYVPNVKPNRLWRNIPAAAHLGRSDYAGLEGMLDGLDEAWSSWMRDIRLAKSRLIVPNSYLESLGRGQGATWDGDREVLTGLDMLAAPGENPITENQFGIRVAEHMDTTQQLAEQIIRGAGYSVQSLGMEGEGAQITATEIDARERRSITTRGRKITYWRPALADITETLLAVDKAVFGSNVTPQVPDIEWPDAVADDPLTVAQTAAMLEQARAASTETRVRMVHRDWTEDQIEAEVRTILDEAGPATIVPAAPDGTIPAAEGGDPNFADAALGDDGENAPPGTGGAGTPNGRVPTGA